MQSTSSLSSSSTSPSSTITSKYPSENIKTYQKILNSSPVACLEAGQLETNSKFSKQKGFEKAAINQVSRQTKCLCAIIISLILIILALIIFDKNEDYDKSIKQLQEQNRYLERNLIAKSSNNLLKNRAEQLTGKLMTSNADNHYHTIQVPPRSSTVSSAGHVELDNDLNKDDDHSNNSQDVDHDHDIINNNHDLTQDNELDSFPPGRPSSGSAKKSRQRNKICLSPGCIRAAAQILNNMDNKTKPCEDFYQYACGRWIETQVIPDEKSSLSIFSQNTADLHLKLRALIEKKPSSEDPPIVGQMRNMYASCMNTTEIESLGDEPLLEVLREFGGWPVLQGTTTTTTSNNSNNREARSLPIRRSTTTTSDNNYEKFSWLETLIKFRNRGFTHDMIIDLSVVPDVRNSRHYIIELDQSSLGLPDMSYYYKGLNDSTVAAYFNLMIESAVMLGASRAEARKQMTEALDFESSLAKISVPREQRRNVTKIYNKMPLRDLYKLAPNIDWQRYLSVLLSDNQIDLDKDQVNVKVPSFLRAIDKLLLKTEPKVLANYMLWRVVRASLGILSRRWGDLSQTYSRVTTGRLSAEPRWEHCLNGLEGTLGTALSALYVKNHFNQESKASALEMVNYIRNEFLQVLEEGPLDEETRQEAKLKAHAITSHIGYPDELLNDTIIENLYSGLNLHRNQYYRNILHLRKWSTDYAFSQLRKPNIKSDWAKHAKAATVNAFYNSIDNSIEFPAGILQGAFFDRARPNYLNFGAIGFVIGHEITHGFDDRGRQFDKDGNNRNWWNAETDERYKERAQCIIDQYSNYTVPENGLKVNGINTQGENIADNGGLKTAFRAYNQWVRRNGEEPPLPGINLTQRQLFWVSAANVWCGKYRPEVLKTRVMVGSHSPAQFRVIGPLSNIKEFSETFNCPLGSPMNPRKKCAVW